MPFWDRWKEKPKTGHPGAQRDNAGDPIAPGDQDFRAPPPLAQKPDTIGDPTMQTGGYAAIAQQRGYTPPLATPPGTQAPLPAVDPAKQAAIDQTTRQQQESIRGLQAAATGTAPSVAEQQLSSAMNRAATQQYGKASQSRGGDQLAMQREAMLGVGAQGLEAGAAAGAARAAEMTGARGALATAVGGARGQDIDLATTMAALTAEVTSGNRDAVIRLSQQALDKYGMNLQAELTKRGQDREWEAALLAKDANKINAIIQGLVAATPLLLAASDERIKSNVSAVPDDELDTFANRVAESIFSYERKGSSQREAGTMAQDVAAAGPLGQQVTGEASPGVQGVDYGRLATLMAAAALRSKKASM